MKRLALLLWLLLPLTAAGQAVPTTPNVGLYVPAHGTPNWDVYMNQNFSALDLMLSGHTPLPGLSVTGQTTVNNLTITGTCLLGAVPCGSGGGGGAVVSVFGRTGAIVALGGDYSVVQITGAAPIASPIFTGTITTPITGGGTQCTQVNNSGVLSGTGSACGSGGGGVSSVAATSPVLSSGGSTPTISISGVTALQGNGSKLQLATGTTTTGHFPSYDASGNLVDSTQPSGGATLPSNAVVYGLTAITSRAATFTDVVALWTSCGTNFLKGNGTCAAAGGTPAGTTNDVQFNTGGSFAADTGIFTYTPSTHILNAGQGITTTSTGVATTLGLSGGTTPGSFPTNAFGWLGPNSATFTSYFFQCPTTPPTNGQTIIFGTQVGSVVPCTYGTSGSGTVTSSGPPTASDIAAFSTATNIVSASVADIGKPGYAAGGGTGDVQTLTLSPVPTILTGTVVRWLPIAANTIAVPTLNVNTLGAKPVVKVCGGSITALVGGDLATTVNAVAIYDGTNWVLQNPTQGCLIYNTVSTFTELTSIVNIGSPITILDLSAGGSVDTTITIVIDFAVTTAGTGATGTTGTVGIGLLGVDADNGTAYNSYANRYALPTLGSIGGAPSNNCLLVNITSVANSTCNTLYLVKRFKAGTAVQIILNQSAAANWGTTQPGVTMRPYVYKIQ